MIVLTTTPFKFAAAGADIHFEEVADLSHTYAREQNALILDWFGCPLARADG